MNDGNTFSSPEGTETLKIDDTILVDQGAAFTCKHSNGGINVTVAVLGPYDPRDKVEIIWDKVSDPTRTSRGEPLLADYRRARPDTPYNYYGVFVPAAIAADMANFGAQVTRADGTVRSDTKQGILYRTSALDDCLPGAEIPLPGPRATATLTRRSRSQLACPILGYTRCWNTCVNTASDIFHCGGCVDQEDGGVDCSELGDDVGCVNGSCVVYQ